MSFLKKWFPNPNKDLEKEIEAINHVLESNAKQIWILKEKVNDIIWRTK